MDPVPEHFIRLIVGLGNPGAEHENTRHNAGFTVADGAAEKLGAKGVWKKTAGAVVARGRSGGATVYILKPLTYMNLSGEAVQSFAGKEGIQAGEMLLIYDDIDLPLGRIRLAKGGGSGGHRGVESVMMSLGNADFARLRIGIGRAGPGKEQADYVLSMFEENEKEIFSRVVETAVDAVKFLLCRGIDCAMNKYNGQDIGSDLPPADEGKVRRDDPIS